VTVELLHTKPEWLTRKQLAEEWGLSVGSIDKLVKQGLPSETWGLQVRRFHLPTCERWRRRRAA
jgi:phage terminase Nu1 subunit (DNA packaging protein)